MRKGCRSVIGLMCFLILSIPAYSQQKSYWSIVSSDNSAARNSIGAKLPKDSFGIYQLNEVALRQSLSATPLLSKVNVDQSGVIVSFPVKPGAAAIDFKVVEAPSMEPALSAKYPEIHSYTGVALNDASIRIRFDLSPEGFHGMIHNPATGISYIDPSNETREYYFLKNKGSIATTNDFRCLTTDIPKPATTAKGSALKNADDGRTRTFRLALCASGEFSQFWLNGTETTDAQRKAKVLAAMNTELTRVNSIYENEFSVHMNLVANNDLIIFLNPATDPWGTELNNRTQVVCDSLIGDAGYDVGHLLHLDNANGNAGCIACVCKPGSKGSAFTSFEDLANTENLVVDYLAHELGHQFGGSHTFDFTNENTNAQVEPGSGSTIMGYAGITGASSDVQAHSDDYFHAYSIMEISDFIKSASCAITTISGNTAPTANAGADYTIPKSTPFTLRGTGADVNGGDVLTYTWEQMDRRNTGFSVVPISTATAGAQFRSIEGTTNNSRTFPALASILTGTNTNKWEVLPSVQRTLNFRFTVRDNHAGAGNNNSDDMVLTVSSASGPFAVTFPNAAVFLGEGSTQTITWDVAASNVAPVNCANVNILLSTDGGLTFPTTLAANTPNDGSQAVVLPNINQNQCRVKVEAAGNVFFDISNVDFTIGPDFDIVPAGPITLSCPAPTSTTFNLNTTISGGFSGNIVLTASNLPAGVTASFAPATVTPGSASSVTLNNTNGLLDSTYAITFTGTSGTRVHTRVVNLVVQAGAAPIISTQPVDKQVCAGSSTSLSVASSSGISSYMWQVSTDGINFSNIAASNASTYAVQNATVSQNNNKYRVVLRGFCNTTISSIVTLIVHPLPIVSLSASPYLKIFPGLTTTLTANPGASSGGTLALFWQRNNTDISVTGNTLPVTVTGLGSYQVRIDETWLDGNVCTSKSQIVTISDSSNSRLFIYPNPNSGDFTVSYYNVGGGSTKRTITVFDSKGSIVYNREFNITSPYELLQINIPGAGRGLYYVRVSGADGKKLINGKVLVQ